MLSQIKRELMTNTYEYIDFSNYVVDFQSVQVNFNSFQTKLEKLEFVEVNDKIGFDQEEILYINKQGTLQPIIRWLYNENRENTINKLHDLFTEYSKLLQMIRITTNYTKRNQDKFCNLSNEIKNFNKKICCGLNNLYETYNDDDMYCNMIKEMIIIISKFDKTNM